MSQMAMLILIIAGLVVVPKCSPTMPTPSLFPPPPYHPPSNPADHSLIPNNDKNKAPSVFEYFKLAKIWAPTFCKTRTCVMKPPLVDFALHGLWPQNKSDPQPRDCNSNNSLNWHTFEKSSPEVVTDLKKYWRVLNKDRDGDKVSFWLRQWIKHGTCAANMSPEDYFKWTLQISQKLENLKSILQKAGITPGKNKIDSRAMFNAIKKDISAPEIVCEEIGKGVFYVSAIRICLDTKGVQYKDCVAGFPGGRLNKCPAMVFFPE